MGSNSMTRIIYYVYNINWDYATNNLAIYYLIIIGFTNASTRY